MRLALFAAIATFAIAAAPLTLAQTTPPQNPPPVTTTQPAIPAPPETPATPNTPPGAPPAVPPTTGQTPAPSNSSTPQGCRTRKAEGEACACLSDTSRIGVSTAHQAGTQCLCAA